VTSKKPVLRRMVPGKPCPGCGEPTRKSVYASAQRAMGHEVVFTCPKCGEKFAVLT
jgi:predicted RNA-binding Zn-ribbon protein involved in translation (DUF1610 family)